MLPEITKKCCRCKQFLVYTEFNKHCRTRDGYQTACRNCNKISGKIWELNPLQRRERKLRKKYGISNEIYDKLLLEQDSKCKICKSTETKNKNTKYLVVDHCHKTGKVRGLLCDYCNVGLGRFEDNIEILAKAIEYLKESK